MMKSLNTLRTARLLLIAVTLIWMTAASARAGDIQIGPAPTHCQDVTQPCTASTPGTPAPPPEDEDADSQTDTVTAVLGLSSVWLTQLLSLLK